MGWNFKDIETKVLTFSMSYHLKHYIQHVKNYKEGWLSVKPYEAELAAGSHSLPFLLLSSLPSSLTG